MIAIAEINQATKLNFLLVRKKGFNNTQVKAPMTPHDSSQLSDDVHLNETNDTSPDSPPPGTISSQKRRTPSNTKSKSPIPKDGGIFIPESVLSMFQYR